MNGYIDLIPPLTFETRVKSLKGFSVRLEGDEITNPIMGMSNMLLWINGNLEITLTIRMKDSDHSTYGEKP